MSQFLCKNAMAMAEKDLLYYRNSYFIGHPKFHLLTISTCLGCWIFHIFLQLRIINKKGKFRRVSLIWIIKVSYLMASKYRVNPWEDWSWSCGPSILISWVFLKDSNEEHHTWILFFFLLHLCKVFKKLRKEKNA
jgi:hypothetical protein